MADLKDAVALVTNAHETLGRGIAQGLAEAGATVYLQGATVDAAAEVSQLGGKGIPLPIDTADPFAEQTLLELFRRIESEVGRLDLLVSSSIATPEITRPSAGFWVEPSSAWNDLCSVTLAGSYLTCALAARLMVEKGRGLLVQVGEFPTGRAGVVAGAIASGLQRMSREMAVELADHGVSALSVAAPIEPAQRSSRFVGRCIAALAMDPDIAEKSGDHFEIETLQREYRFSDSVEPTEEMHR